MNDEVIRKAKAIVSAGDNISYPSGASARYVRTVMRDLIALVEGDESRFENEVCDLCLGDGKCPNCNGTGGFAAEEESTTGGM